MALDLHLVIEEDSRRWQAILQVARDRQVAPQEVVEEVLDAGLRVLSAPTQHRSIPDVSVATNMPLFGIFADAPEVSEAIQDVVSTRGTRYRKFRE